jgi:DNA repair protein RadC
MGGSCIFVATHTHDEHMEKLPIRSWAEEDRPREKLLLKGRHSLTDAELIAILIGTGSARESAVELARRILRTVENSLHELARLTIADLMAHNGIGEAKAVSIAAALELGRRRATGQPLSRRRITVSRDAAGFLQPLMADLLHEEFWILCLNRNNSVLGHCCISSGGVAGTVVDPKILFRMALEKKASSVILCHNHPSGNLKPSEEDLRLTRRMTEAGKLLEIQVLDHLIVSQHGFFSFADEGLL